MTKYRTVILQIKKLVKSFLHRKTKVNIFYNFGDLYTLRMNNSVNNKGTVILFFSVCTFLATRLPQQEIKENTRYGFWI